MSVAEAGKSTISYDHNGADYAVRYEEVARHLHASPPVQWSDTYDGFWLVTRHADAKRIADNWQEFSSENRVSEGDMTRRGIMVPAFEQPLMLNECDPPVHTRRRMIEAPYFTPKYLRRWLDVVQDYTRQAIDDVIETGRVEFVQDLCLRIPAMVTLHVGGVDPTDWRLYAEPAKAFDGDMAAAYAEIISRLSALILRRREDPRDDIATALSRAAIDGVPMDVPVAAGMLHTIVTGGFDTATSLLCNALDWLERHPDVRDDLRVHPEKMGNAVEEFLRVFPPLHHLGRNVVDDIELGGQLLKAGDKVLMSLYAANHDPQKFEDPWTVQIDRANARDHLAYSAGNHRCLGAPLARVELRLILTEILRRMPDYVIDRDQAQPFESIAFTHGWHSLPARFTPGVRSEDA